MNRFEQLQEVIFNQKCFKMICGAGNEDARHVRDLSFVYTLAGAKILDVSANIEVVKSAAKGIDEAYNYAALSNLDIGLRPYIMVSIGMPGDPHVRKSYINPSACLGCTLCIPICPTDAIPKDFIGKLDFFKELGGSFDIENQSKEIVIKDLCIGCGKCSSICPRNDIIFYRHSHRELSDLLPKCLEAGAELFELHAAVGEDDITLKEWELINQINPHNYNSMCLDRLHLGNLRLEQRIAAVKNISGNKLMIQADGYPMSGGENDYNTTLQAVACADVINKKFNMRIDKKREIDAVGHEKISSKKVYKKINDKDNIPLLLSGGTNAYTKELADKTGVRINGVSIGTYARDLIEPYIKNKDFYKNPDLLSLAVEAAKTLIKASVN